MATITVKTERRNTTAFICAWVAELSSGVVDTTVGVVGLSDGPSVDTGGWLVWSVGPSVGSVGGDDGISPKQPEYSKSNLRQPGILNRDKILI